MLEPLGRGQVLAYLAKNSPSHNFTLVSIERWSPRGHVEEITKVAAECTNKGITWRPLFTNRFPKKIQPLAEAFVLLGAALQEQQKSKISLVHARSYVPAIVAMVLKKTLGIPFIFDMRALWIDELILTGRLKERSATHSFLRKMETICLKEASSIICLTEKVANFLRAEHRFLREGNKISIIPTCADLDKFRPELPVSADSSSKLYGVLGSVLSGWFRVDLLRLLFLEIARVDPTARFEILSNDDHEQTFSYLNFPKELSSRLLIRSLPFEDIPPAIRGYSASFLLYKDGPANIGRSPTRMAELLGSGIPLVVTGGAGDVAEIVGANQVGVVIDDESATGVTLAVKELMTLVEDETAKERCRELALSTLSLSDGARKYLQIYDGLTHRISEKRKKERSRKPAAGSNP